MKKGYIKGLKVLEVMKSGSSRPVVVEDEAGSRYLVKLRESLSNPFASISDFLSCQIGHNIGLPIAQPCLMEINGGTDIKAVDEEVRDIVRKSFGVNVAYGFQDHAVDWKYTETIDTDQQLNELFAFDLFMLNIDRTRYNANLFSVEGNLFSFDYETSMLIIGAIQGQSYFASEAVLKLLRENPLYHSNIDAEHIGNLQSKISALDISWLVDMLPPQWAPDKGQMAGYLAGEIEKCTSDPGIYVEILAKLSHMTPESAEDRKKRIDGNRRQFESKF